jgi:TRAP-type C4-dicarboxylate transport system permease small subunit
MIGVLVMVITGIVTREFGIYLRGTDDYAGYCMAAAGFLALAYTFKHGEHIRVTLIIERLSGTPRKLLEWLHGMISRPFDTPTMWATQGERPLRPFVVSSPLRGRIEP